MSREEMEVNSNNNTESVSGNKTVASNTKPIISDKKSEANSKLQIKTNSLLPLFDQMPAVSVYIKDEPILKIGNETQRRVAYTICANKEPNIFVKKIFYQKGNQKQITNILKHELVHAWFCRQGIQTGHDERFRKKFKSIGGFGN